MGYDMLEGSEMSALSESRLGNKCFVDEDNYSNFSIGKGKKAIRWNPTLADAVWFPLTVTNAIGVTNTTILTERQKRQRAEFEKEKIKGTWKIDPSKIDDCEFLTTKLAQLQNTIVSESEVYAKDKVAQERIVTPLKQMEVEYKNAITQAKCEEKKAKAEEEASKKETLDLLTSATATPPPSDAKEEKSSKTNKYILYGVGGLILILGVAVILKKNS
jgi:hypothetical protein